MVCDNGERVGKFYYVIYLYMCQVSNFGSLKKLFSMPNWVLTIMLIWIVKTKRVLKEYKYDCYVNYNNKKFWKFKHWRYF